MIDRSITMSLSYSDCFPDLICAEESAAVSIGGELSEVSSDVESSLVTAAVEESSIAGFIEEERINYVAHVETSLISLEPSDRARSVAWILKVRAFYGFQPVTAYLALTYFDRFLRSRPLPQTSGWPLQLLSVACMSLAAKMEEPLVPSLLDLQVEGAKFIFKPKTIQRMELLVLSVLDWRLKCVTPFTFISFFAYKLDATGTCAGFLISRSTDIIMSNIQESSCLDHWPSSIAAAAILCAASEMPSLSFVTPDHAESWCDGLSKDKVINCYRLMQQFIIDNGRMRPSKFLPQLRVTTTRTRLRSTTDSSSPSSSNSSTSPSPFKRRKLNNRSYTDDDNASLSSD